MKKRVHLKKKILSLNKFKKKNIILIILILLIISVMITLKFISTKMTPVLLENAELEVNKFSVIIANKAISQILEDKINTNNIFETVKSDNGTIQTIDFNPVVVNQALTLATTVVQNNLKLLEEGDLDSIGVYDMDLPEDRIKDLEKGIILKMPMGVVTNNSLLSNLGPKIPIRLHYIGDVTGNITTKITQYGINNAMVEVGIHLEIIAQIILPFTTSRKTIECNIPLTIKMIQGVVPNYYGGSIIKDSSLYSLPIED